jgi:hypothetical protein
LSAGALRVLAGGGGLPLARVDSVPRLRPGDRPIVVDTPLSTAQAHAIRLQAHARGLGVDAVVAVVVEQQSLTALVNERQLDLARALAQDEAYSSIEVPSGELRPWLRALMGVAQAAVDDLPAIHMPLRLAAALTATERIDTVLRAVEAPAQEIDRAIALELAATRQGLTMQTWVLSSVLRD